MRDTRYESAYIFGTVCPERATGAALVLLADTEAMNLHLRDRRARHSRAHAVMVLDGAGWHGKDLAIPDNISRYALPAKLKVDNVSKYLRA